MPRIITDWPRNGSHAETKKRIYGSEPSSNGYHKKPIMFKGGKRPIPKSDLPELAKEPDLIAAIRRDLKAVGIVGEEDNALLVYLIFTSRVLEEPGSVITRGSQAGIGKSTILNCTATLFPPEAKIVAMVMTTASWFNTPKDYFKHKIFLSGERKHSRDADTRDAGSMLRQMLSEKRLNRSSSFVNQKTKNWETRIIDREGPIAYAESTTSGSVFEEDLSRMLQLYVDDSEGQNRNVMKAIAGKYNPDKPPVDLKAVINRHHDFQHYLQKLPPQRVGIPYWKALGEKLPAKSAKSRRLIQQLLTIIEASVLIHQHRRERRNDCLIATLDDYALARRLLLPPLHQALGVGVQYKNVAWLKAKMPKAEFTTPEVKALGYTDDMGPSRLLNGLIKAGVLKRVREKKGPIPALYKWTEDGLELETMVLPTVEDLSN